MHANVFHRLWHTNSEQRVACSSV